VVTASLGAAIFSRVFGKLSQQDKHVKDLRSIVADMRSEVASLNYRVNELQPNAEIVAITGPPLAWLDLERAQGGRQVSEIA